MQVNRKSQMIKNALASATEAHTSLPSLRGVCSFLFSATTGVSGSTFFIISDREDFYAFTIKQNTKEYRVPFILSLIFFKIGFKYYRLNWENIYLLNLFSDHEVEVILTQYVQSFNVKLNFSRDVSFQKFSLNV